MATINKKKRGIFRPDGKPYRSNAPLIKQEPIPVPANISVPMIEVAAESIEPSGSFKRKGNNNGK